MGPQDSSQDINQVSALPMIPLLPSSLATLPLSTRGKTKMSPLEIPEIMGYVFGWLEDDVINRSVILVCRQWFNWNRHRVFHDLYWNSDRSREELRSTVLSKLAILPTVETQELNRLFCYVRIRYEDSALEKWKDLVKVLSPNVLVDQLVGVMNDNGQQQQQQQNQDYRKIARNILLDDNSSISSYKSMSVIRHLTITGTFQFDSHMWSILSGLQALISLTVKVESCGWISMHQIFMSCPQLETLHLETTAWVSIPGGSWLFDEGEEQVFNQESHWSEWQTQSSLSSEQTPPSSPTSTSMPPSPWTPLTPCSQTQPGARPLALQSLVLRNTRFEQRALEDFLLLTPFLHKIQIASWLPYLSRPNSVNYKRLVQILKKHCPLVRTFHFSYQGAHTIRTSASDLDPVLDLCPQMSNWMLSTAHFSALIEKLPRQPQEKSGGGLLTTLELIGMDCKGLHDYLCVAQHLQHLKAGRTRFHYEHMDIHLRSTSESSSSGSKVSPGAGIGIDAGVDEEGFKTRGVWACRGLLTLHLAITHTSNQPRAARIVFGYISRVCPRLRDLEICGPEGTRMDRKIMPTPMCMSLEGGFCLLTRLKDLERVRIGIVRLELNLTKRDIEWMKMGRINNKENGVEGHGRNRSSSVSSNGLRIIRPHKAAGVGSNSSAIAKTWNTLLKQERDQEVAKVHHRHPHSHPQSSSWTKYFLPQRNTKCEMKCQSCGLAGDDIVLDAELKQGLQQLGLLKDVLQLLVELEANPSQKCWPNMHRMSIYSGNPLGETFENEYNGLISQITKTQKMSKQQQQEETGGLIGMMRSFIGYFVGGS